MSANPALAFKETGWRDKVSEAWIFVACFHVIRHFRNSRSQWHAVLKFVLDSQINVYQMDSEVIEDMMASHVL